MNDIERRRLENLIARHRANAERELEIILSLARSLNLDGVRDPGTAMGQAERLAAASVSLLRYLGQLDGINDASNVMGALGP